MQREFYGSHAGPVICLHAGAGVEKRPQAVQKRAVNALVAIARVGVKLLSKRVAADKVAIQCLTLLERDGQFNAGCGSTLQADGVPRLSASLMNGHEQTFSGVISIPYVSLPSLLLAPLQQRDARVLTHPGSELLAREMGLPVAANLTPIRAERWLEKLAESKYKPFSSDTVGVLVRDSRNRMVAASSTGGRGFEFPGRVSDTPTCAGNYASRYAAVCATGFGEEIVDDALSARVEVRTRDGMSLEAACRRTMAEALGCKRRYGWLAIDREGWAACHTTPHMPFVVAGVDKILCRSPK